MLGAEVTPFRKKNSVPPRNGLPKLLPKTRLYPTAHQRIVTKPGASEALGQHREHVLPAHQPAVEQREARAGS